MAIKKEKQNKNEFPLIETPLNPKLQSVLLGLTFHRREWLPLKKCVLLKIHIKPKKIFYHFKDTINPLELFAEICEFFNQNNQRLNNIIYH